MALKRPANNGGSVPTGCVPLDGGSFSDDHPVLWDFLACGEYDDGSRRDLSSLVMFIQDDSFKVCLNDKDQGRCCFAAGNSFNEALGALEAMLADDRVEWKRAGQSKNQRKK